MNGGKFEFELYGTGESFLIRKQTQHRENAFVLIVEVTNVILYHYERKQV